MSDLCKRMYLLNFSKKIGTLSIEYAFKIAKPQDTKYWNFVNKYRTFL
jgi:hypothetical protein